MNRTALVIMAKSPEGGDVKTRLAPVLSEHERKELYTKLLDGAVRRLRDLKGTDTYIAYTPADSEGFFRERYGLSCFAQEGDDLGQRISNAIGYLIDTGYNAVIAVGSDIPGLDARIASSALLALENADMALGPSTDGGYYLIGMKEPRPELFQDIPWSTSEVLKATLGKARRIGLSIEILDILDDLDTPEDLKRCGHI